MTQWLAKRFEENWAHLRGVAYRMLGSLDDADDAVQETWLRLSRTETSGIENLSGWLTTVVSRVCLDILRSRHAKREEPFELTIPDFIVSHEGGPDDDVVRADSVGLALLVVLDTLTPAERLAFVLHDMFALPFEEIAPIVGRSSAAARQLASRARRRVRGAALPAINLARQREVVDAFVAAAHDGDFEGLIAVLDPQVVLRADRDPASKGIRVLIPNYGERYRQRETISTGFTESAVNQVVSKRFVKKQQMRWTEAGAHLLLKIRVQVLNDEGRSTLLRWYPAMEVTPERKAA